MAALQNVDPALRVYFKKHSIPDIYEALLCGLLIMRPDDPLRFLEEKIKEIMEKGLYSILWNMCIDPALSLRLKVISETYLHTLLGLDDDQLMTTELCDKAWDFYSTRLKRMCFDAWIKYCSMKKIAEEMLQRKLSFAKCFYERKLLKLILKSWNACILLRKKQQERAAKRIGKVFDCTLQKIILMAWKKESAFTRKAKAAKRYIEHVEGKTEELIFAEGLHAEGRERRHSEKRHSVLRHHVEETMLLLHFRSGKDFLTKLPERAIAQVFHHLTLIDLARCAQVSRAWKAMTQLTSVWSNINFSAVKDVVRDDIAGNILLKWRTSVVNLNLRGCATLHWHTFKNIGQCKNLQELNVSECQGLNDELMRLVSEGCPALLYLNLSHTDVTNGTLRLLSRGFSNLQYLSLAYCRKFTDKGLQYLGSGRGCHKLIYLDISGCLQISVEGFRNIANSCSGIQQLTIHEMPTLTDRCIQALAEKCKQIVSVEFNESPHVSDTGFKALAQCKLIKMKIEGSNRVTDLSFRLMTKFWPNMKSIGVPDCQKITDVGLKLIAPLDDIVVLNLSDCMRISDGGIKSFVDGSSGSRIRELNLANCSYITDSAVKKIAQSCPNLIYLNLRYCQAVTDTGIETLVLISSLAYINISGLDITDQALETLGKLWRIKEITISECKLISDTGIKKFCVELRKLEYIDFSHCHELSNHSLKYLTFSCRGITSLSMAGCSKISDVGIQCVAASCTYLHYLDISGCINITDKGLKNLWKGCLQLRILKMLYCTNITRQAILKNISKLQKYEYNDDDPPLWFRNTSSESSTVKKHRKPRHSTAIPPQSTAEKGLESPSPSPPSEKSLESSRPSTEGNSPPPKQETRS
ncbi:F-box and leucine-rich repeat protein 13 [Elgaria multicarinata webbii]|uniref:F-box and leucine-rich repeat protein 13 n=1 Tax=Elgaria multicarinata webbii TaxID=159646 RepID=UPI002FCD26FB